MPIQTIKSNLEESPVLFLTFKIVNSLPVFINRLYFDIMLGVLDWYRKNKNIKLYAYTILINHLHLIIEFPNNIEGDKMVGDLKRYTAKQILERLREEKRYDLIDEMYLASMRIEKQDLKVWERNNWPVSITSDKFFDQKTSYIDFNATHHGVVKDIENYLYTSYHNHYCEHSCVLETDEI